MHFIAALLSCSAIRVRLVSNKPNETRLGKRSRVEAANAPNVQ
jgi:hypothetical protein